MVLPIAKVALAVAAPLLLLALVAPVARLRPLVAVGVGVAAVIGGLVGGVLVPTDLVALPALVGLGPDVAALLAWGLFGGLAAIAGGLRLPGPPIVGAFLAGAMMGELGAAAALASSAKDRDGAARLALAAMGGAMVGRIGDPAVLVLATRVHTAAWTLVPLGLAMALIAAPRPRHVVPHAGSVVVTAIAAVTALAATFVPGAAAPALLAGAVVLGVIALRHNGAALATNRELLGTAIGPPLWVLGGVLVVLVMTAGGAPQLAALGLEEIADQVGPLLLPGVAAIGALAAALFDGAAAGLLLAAIDDRALFYRDDGLALAAMTGAAAGGLGPLVIAGGLRAGWWRWLLQVSLAVLWVWVLTR